MTKIKNTKKGMAKKTLSMSLVVAMLATSNVPVWAAEFSDGTEATVTSEAEAPVADTADAFTDDAETEAPAVDTTSDVDAATESSISNPKTTLALHERGWANKITVSGNVFDKDGHKIKYFDYKWVVDGKTGNRAGVDYGTTDNGTVPAYSVTANDIGKSVELQIFEYDSTVIGNDSYVAKTNVVTVSKTNVDLNSNNSKMTVSIPGKTDINHELTYTGKTQFYDEVHGGAIVYAEFDNTILSYNDFDITSTIKQGNGIDAGSVYTVTATPKDSTRFTGSINYDYKITEKSATQNDFKVAKNAKEYEYTGDVITPAEEDINVSPKAYIKSVTSTDTTEASGVGAHKANVKLDSAPNYTKESVEALGNYSVDYKVVKRNLANCDIVISSIPYDGKVLTTNDDRFKDNVHFYDKTTGEEVKLNYNKANTANDYDIQVLGSPVNGTKTYELEITAVDTKTGKTYTNTTGSQKITYTLGNETFAHEGYKLTGVAKAYIEKLQKDGVNYTGQEAVIDKSKITLSKRDSNEAETDKLSPDNYEVIVKGTDAGKNAGTIIIKGLKSYEGCEEIYHFKINPVAVNDPSVDEKVIYEKGYTDAAQYAPKATVTAKVGNKNVTLEAGKDYTVSYQFDTTNMINAKITTKIQILNKNYKGGTTVFKKSTTIAKRDLSKCTVTVEPASYTYTGAVVKPTLKVMDGNEPLTEGVDYEIKGYKNAKDVGTATVTLQGKGDNANPSDGIYDSETTLSVNYQITAANAADVKVEWAEGNTGITYTGSVIKPTKFKVTLNGNDVSKQFDFEYPNTNVNVGTGHVILKPVAGNKNFTGQKDAEFKIVPAELNGKLKVYDEKGQQYSIATSGRYKGYLIGLDGTPVSFAYDGKEHKFASAEFVPDAGSKVSKYVTSNDYEIVYIDNVSGQVRNSEYNLEDGDGYAYIAVIGKGNFTGGSQVINGANEKVQVVKDAAYKFRIKKYEIMKQHVTVADGEYAAGQPVRPNVTVTVGGKTLVENQDYKLLYTGISDLTNGKTMTVDIVGINGYKGTVKEKWGVVKKDMANAQVVLNKAQYKKGEKPSVTVYNSGVKVADTEYTVSYTDDNVTVTANKDSKYYTGSQTVKVIRESETETTLGTPVITGVNATGNKTTAVLGGESANASGYDYVISTSKDPSDKDARIDVVKNQVQTTANFKYVPQGTYYAYCHAWTRDENGKKVFGEWSNSYAFSVTAITPDTPEILSVKTKGSTITVTYKESANSTGYDVVLGKGSKKEHGETRPYQYGKYKKLNVKPGVCKAVFKNIPAGTYYAGVHSWNRTASENNNKVFSKWSKLETAKVK